MLGREHGGRIKNEGEALTKVGMRLSFFGGQPLLVIVTQQLVQEIDSLVGDVSLVL